MEGRLFTRRMIDQNLNIKTKTNLKVTKYRDGSVIPLDTSGGINWDGTCQKWSARTTGTKTVYGQDTASIATYGYLFNWYTVANIKRLCPSGWHVPSDTEWTNLTNYLSREAVAGGKMKTSCTYLLELKYGGNKREWLLRSPRWSSLYCR